MLLPADSLSVLAWNIDSLHKRASDAAIDAVRFAKLAGDNLREAKERVEYGYWLDWIEENTPLTPRVAQGYMRISANWDRLPNTKQDSYLTIRDSLALLCGRSDGLRAGSNERRTPATYIEMARMVMGGIDLDPASSSEANETVKAAEYFDKDQNGLLQEWAGRVWMNPPYGTLGPKFVKKLLDSPRVEQAVVLLSINSLGVQWGLPLWDRAIMCATFKRINFYSVRNPSGSPGTTSSVFAYLGDRQNQFIEVFRELGTLFNKIM